MDVEFDGPNKRIIVNQNIYTLETSKIYSQWKQWVQSGSNAKYLPALRVVGGDPTVGVKQVAPYFFLTNGWKLRPYEEDHTLNLVGNLFVDGPETYGSNVTVSTIGYYNVLVNMSTTSDAITMAVGSAVTQQDKDEIVQKTVSKLIPFLVK